MSSYFSPGCHNDKAHICDMCEKKDGRPTLYWAEKEFDLCYECLDNLYHQYSYHVQEPIIIPRRITISEELRRKVFERDDYKCQKCHTEVNLILDHIKPFSLGGRTVYENLQSLCTACNLKKGIKLDW